MEKAIEIKRRAQRCIQNGDLDGALAEYEKLVQAEDSDPYNFVLLADLLFKRGDGENAVQRYLAAVGAYEKMGLYKNAIAVCKKMMRLSLAPAKVLERLASLHAADGLGTEAALYYMQYAETLVRTDQPLQAAEMLRKAYEASPEEVKALERLAEAYTLAGDSARAAATLAEAAQAYTKLGRKDAATRCRQRAEQIRPGSLAAFEADGGSAAGPDGAGLGAREREGTGTGGAAEDAKASDDEPTHVGPPRLPGLGRSPAPLEERIESNGSDATGDGAPASAPDPDLERFPTAFSSASRPAVRFDAAAGESRSDDHEDRSTGDGADAAERPSAGHATDDDEDFSSNGSPETAGVPAAGAASEDEMDFGHDEEPEHEPAGAEEREPGDERGPAGVSGAATGASTADGGAPAGAAASAAPATVAEIERLLARAQEHFRGGDRQAAGTLLVEAALAYERIGRFDNAASIFRSLARGPQGTPRLLELWLANAQRRGDRAEAAEVACELGDRAVNDGDLEGAHGWFERACAIDPANAVARRRLSRLAQLGADATGEAVHAAVAEPPREELAAVPEPAPTEGENGRVEMALGRAEAVTFDLGSLLAEFQRGIQAQLSGDAQSHYDLAMTYREMGLLDQAVESFRLAARDPGFEARAAEMIGRCLLEQGRFHDAAHELDEALRSSHVPADAALGLRYQLGLAHEAAGDARAALAEFERVFEAQANYSDVALKIRALRQSLGSA